MLIVCLHYAKIDIVTYFSVLTVTFIVPMSFLATGGRPRQSIILALVLNRAVSIRKSGCNADS